MSRSRVAAWVAALSVLMPMALGAQLAQAATPAKPYDFNGDGYPEQVVGVSNLLVGSIEDAGGVLVLPASRSGLSLKEQVLTKDSPGVVGTPRTYDGWGVSVASGDFDRDGFADLAVGPNPITILFGGAKGLGGSRSIELPPSGDGAIYAGSLAVADFDGDGWLDLAAGDGATDAVSVFRGGRAGFSTARVTALHGKEAPEPDVGFGSSLAVGDLDGDGRADLVVGAIGPGAESDDPGYDGPGSVSACLGTSTGPSRCTRVGYGRAFQGLTSLAVGNVSGDPLPEIVAGVPWAADQSTAGAVQTLTLSFAGGRATATVAELTQHSPGVPGRQEKGDLFGCSLALGDLDHDGWSDLVVGACGEAVGKKLEAGRVTVVYGGSTGYRRSGGRAYDQSSKGVPGKPERFDGFGGSATLIDHDADGHLDLTVGAPGENDLKGAVTTLQGAKHSFTTKGARAFTLKTLGRAQPGWTGFGDVLGG